MLKKLFASLSATICLFALQLTAYAETSGFMQRLGEAGKLVGYFLLVLGAIFLALLFTTWIGRHWKNK